MSSDMIACRGCGLSQPMSASEYCRNCQHALTLLRYLDDQFPEWRPVYERRRGRHVTTISASSIRKRTSKRFAIELGVRLRMLRETQGKTREDMKRVMQSSSLSRVENGVHYPSLHTLELYSKEFGVDLHDLLSLQPPAETNILQDPFVKEVAILMRAVSWPHWVELIIAMKKMTMSLGVEALRFRAQIEREYCMELVAEL